MKKKLNVSVNLVIFSMLTEIINKLNQSNMNTVAFLTFRKAVLTLGVCTCAAGFTLGAVTGNTILLDYALLSAIATVIFGVASRKLVSL